MTRLLAVLVGFMVDEQLSSVTAGKDDASTKVTHRFYAPSSSSPFSFSLYTTCGLVGGDNRGIVDLRTISAYNQPQSLSSSKKVK